MVVVILYIGYTIGENAAGADNRSDFFVISSILATTWLPMPDKINEHSELWPEKWNAPMLSLLPSVAADFAVSLDF